MPNLDIPMTMRKRTRSCTKHPNSNFMSYDRLSQFVQALVANLGVWR